MKILFFSLLILVSSVIFSQNHRIKVVLKNPGDTTLKLACYYGRKIKVIEQAEINKNCEFIFSSGQKLPVGICMMFNDNNEKLFEFISGKDQKFKIFAGDSIEDIKVKGNKENKWFFNYLVLNKNIYRKIGLISDTLKKGGDSVYFVPRKDSLLRILKEERIRISKKLPGSFLSKLLKSMEEIPVPDSILADSLKVFKFYKKHYWDNFDLSDNGLLHTPLYDEKVDDYFYQYVPPQPDSVIKEIDRIIGMAKADSDALSHLVWYFTSKYQQYGYMGFDKVFVHMVDEYFLKYNIENVTPSILNTFKQRADKLRPVLIGKKAPNLIMIDTSGNYTSFLSMKNDYTILLFWDYNCGVCKKEMQILKNELFNNKKFDIGVFAVNTNKDLDKWKKVVVYRGLQNWINVNGTDSLTEDFHILYDIYKTPSLYLLNKNKIIIAKGLKAEKIIEFISYYNINNK